ncbi:hypothetical protein [Streptomyces graminilatus]|uniref:hypothetical protein n=1 Tax=Streptomyces graminilatus TaxID=1464070 RepID=UPI0006E3566B|nr:hypothetical protein [Streptomyces graminilatus]
MRVAQARQAIAEAVSAQVRELFEAEAARRCERDGSRPAGSRRHPAYVPEHAPQVPDAVVQTRPAVAEPGTIFTWKGESDRPPVFIMRVTSTWARRVAHQGYALLDGHPVVDVSDWDEQGRPLKVRTVALRGMFDPMIHGWRAWADNVDRRVEWDRTGTPELVPL